MADTSPHDELEHVIVLLRAGECPNGEALQQAWRRLERACVCAGDAAPPLPAASLARLVALLDSSRGPALAAACWSLCIMCNTQEVYAEQVLQDSKLVRRLAAISEGRMRASGLACPSWTALAVLAELAMVRPGDVIVQQPRLLELMRDRLQKVADAVLEGGCGEATNG